MSEKSDPLVEQKNLLGKVPMVPSVSLSSAHAPATKHFPFCSAKELLREDSQEIKAGPESHEYSRDSCHGGNSGSVSCFLFSSRDPQLAQRNIESKNKQGSFPGRPPVCGRHYALNYFVNSICSPSIRAASARFQQVLFSRHTQLFSRTPFLLSRLCEPASSDATIEGSI